MPRVHPITGTPATATGMPPIRTSRRNGSVGLFGPTRRYADGRTKWHKGIDWLARDGRTKIHASDDGRVIVAGNVGGYGLAVYIQHEDGTSSRSAHLSRIDVQVGQTVTAGQVIGVAGRTGNLADEIPTHLHHEARELRTGGTNHARNSDTHAIDPIDWLLEDTA